MHRADIFILSKFLEYNVIHISDHWSDVAAWIIKTNGYDIVLDIYYLYTFYKLVGCLCVNIETLLAAGAPRALLARPLQRGGHGRRPRLGREVEPLLAAAAARRAVVPVLHLLGQQGEHLATRGGDLVGDIAQRARIPSYLAPVNRL